jgi:two-component system KDP operon response regulator KdpE
MALSPQPGLLNGSHRPAQQEARKRWDPRIIESRAPDSDASNPRQGVSRVLLIERDEAYAAVTMACLRLAGCRVDHFADPTDAFGVLELRTADLLVWGAAAEELSQAPAVIAELRLRSEAPLILIGASADAARPGLEAGGDYWLPKPFSPGLLVGFSRAALRRAGASSSYIASKTEIRGMVMDGRIRQLTFAGRSISFTRQEWRLLSILATHPNRFLSVQEILRLGWHAGAHAGQELRTYVRRLRAKLGQEPLPCQLLSEHGQGYCLKFDTVADGLETEALNAAAR